MVRFTSLLLGGGVAAAVGVGWTKYKASRLRLPGESHVVIVGGGYGGISLADKIHGKGNYTLIDAKDCLHHNMAALRAAVEPGFAIKTFIPYRPKFQDNFRQGKVVGIDTQNKTISLDGEEIPIPYTHLVIATGSSGPFPGKCEFDVAVPKLIEQYENYAQDISKATKIVVVGGGAVGVELAADIAHDYPEKSVTIVHNGETLVTNKLSEDALQRIQTRVEKKGIKVIMGDTVRNMAELHLNQLNEGMRVMTEKGAQLEADMVIPCVGLKVNSAAYATSIPDKVNGRGQLMVDDKLEVRGENHVYAIGDCNDLPVPKLAMEAAFQAHHLSNNLMSKSEPKPYRAGSLRMVIPLGRDGGVAQFGSRVFGDRVAKFVKSKDVFVNFAWKAMGQKVPDTESKGAQ